MANATPDAQAFLSWWVVLLFVLQGVALAGQVVLLFVGRKQKREVNFAFEPASKSDFEKHMEHNQAEHERLFAKIGGVERGGNAGLDKFRDEIREMEHRLAASNESRSEKLHNRINEVLAAVSELRGQIRKS